MTFTEALHAARSGNPDAPVYSVRLACGFTALHLQTFLAAHLRRSLPDRRVQVACGLYGDLAGTVETSANSAETEALAVALEWQDLDARLGYRGAGTWAGATADILSGARTMLDRIGDALLRHPPGIRVAISLPTLPLPPMFLTPGWQVSEAELHLESLLLAFAKAVAGRAAIVNRHRLDMDSAPGARYDFKLDLRSGLPWTVGHADAVASCLARLLAPPAPTKGIITDLDNTLWSGIVGDDGAENVSWSLESHSQLHGLYQNLLASLADQGVLIAVASRNDAETAGAALARPDILLKPDRIFPLEIHWSAKSGSVRRILDTWNIAADSVIFVDDSPMELAEVKAAHPGLQCLLFPGGQDQNGYELLWTLRDLCGKEFVSTDDRLRLDSIRQGAAFRKGTGDEGEKATFLQEAMAIVTVELPPPTAKKRVLELVNKTNQFNLNGQRYTEGDWHRLTSAKDAFVAAIEYEDRFGPLGLIAVVCGTSCNGRLNIESWVMSCRAFARHIEYQCLRILLDRFAATEVAVNFVPTGRNGPAADFARTIIGHEPEGPFEFRRADFEAVCPPLYHRIVLRDGKKSDESVN